jgi:dUTPase
MRLFIVATSSQFAAMYEMAAAAYNAKSPSERDSGFDLHCDGEDIDAKYSAHATLVGQGCRALAVDADGNSRAFWMAPRSSISKTQWRLANSMGLIDSTYRGVIKAGLYSVTNESVSPTSIHGTRLTQLVQPDLNPWDSVSVVSVLPGVETLRGEGGFGSTGI